MILTKLINNTTGEIVELTSLIVYGNNKSDKHAEETHINFALNVDSNVVNAFLAQHPEYSLYADVWVHPTRYRSFVPDTVFAKAMKEYKEVAMALLTELPSVPFGNGQEVYYNSILPEYEFLLQYVIVEENTNQQA